MDNLTYGYNITSGKLTNNRLRHVDDAVSDYKPVSSAVTPFVNNVFGLTNVDAGVVAKPLFNGNIASMMVNIPKLGAANLYGYSYDQLNRIMSMDAFGGLNNSNNTFTASASANYKERITYDANGNIKTYLRNGTTAGGSPQTMDNLTYGYNITSGKLTNNRLRQVDDGVSNGNDTTDIDDQNTDNYGYDEIGNLTKDLAEGINTNGITWSVYGKILSIVKNGNTISYTYDASGNRISKAANNKTTWYVRDASGNVMAIYEKRSDLNSNHVTQSEVHLYGSSRLGIFNLNRDMESPPTGDIVIFERGKKFFELSNHLGNVLVTITDRKLQTSSAGIMVDCYTSDVMSVSDNYVFGMTMPGRNYQNDKYRYGFNGKEKDKDISEGDLDFGARIYDGRLGKFLSVDRLATKTPFYSPYLFAGNKPVISVLRGAYFFQNPYLHGLKIIKQILCRYFRANTLFLLPISYDAKK